MTNSIRFDDRVALVTGAGNGLGRAYALELARRGARIVVNDLGSSGAGLGRSAEAADSVVDEIRSVGGEAIANHDSVATRAGGERMVQDALDRWGRLDICINNAGFLRNDRFEDLDDEQIDAIIDVHVKGSFHVGQSAYRAMRQNRYGRMLFTSSGSALFGHAWQATYAAAKAAMVGLSNVVALEGASYGIRSNVILPAAYSRLADQMGSGYLESPSFADAVANVDMSASTGRLTADFVVPLATYLVSAECEATHGIFSANSGRFARVAICTLDGWMAPAGEVPPTVEDIHGNFAAIDRASAHYEPMNNFEEFTAIAQTARSLSTP